MSMFKGASKTQITEKGQRLGVGRSKVRITNILAPANLTNGDRYIVEYDVVESNTGVDPVGAKRSWSQSMVKKQTGWPACAKFLFAAMGYDRRNPEDLKITEEKIQPELDFMLEATLDTSDPLGLRGRCVWVETKLAPEKMGPDGKPMPPFLYHNFEPGQTDKVAIPE